MHSVEMIAALIAKKSLDESDLAYVLTMDLQDIIQNLIGIKGGFVFRAYLAERLLELLNGPSGLAVPEEIYQKALLGAKEHANRIAE